MLGGPALTPGAPACPPRLVARSAHPHGTALTAVCCMSWARAVTPDSQHVLAPLPTRHLVTASGLISVPLSAPPPWVSPSSWSQDPQSPLILPLRRRPRPTQRPLEPHILGSRARAPSPGTALSRPSPRLLQVKLSAAASEKAPTLAGRSGPVCAEASGAPSWGSCSHQRQERKTAAREQTAFTASLNYLDDSATFKPRALDTRVCISSRSQRA